MPKAWGADEQRSCDSAEIQYQNKLSDFLKSDSYFVSQKFYIQFFDSP